MFGAWLLRRVLLFNPAGMGFCLVLKPEENQDIDCGKRRNFVMLIMFDWNRFLISCTLLAIFQ